MKPISLDERELLKRDRVAEAFYETWAAEMRLHGEAVTRKWSTLRSCEMKAWTVVVQLADDRAKVGHRG